MNHRKFMIFAIVTLFILPLSNVFASDDSPLTYGPIIGMNIAKGLGNFDDAVGQELKDLANDQGLNVGDINNKFKMGLAVGGFLAYAYNDRFTLQTEFLYSMKGAKYNIEVDGVGVDLILKLDYIEIPVLLKLNIPTNSIVTPNVYLGGVYGFNINAKLEAEAAGISSEADVAEGITTTDFGVVFGGGLGIDAGSGAFTIDARYNLGVMNVLEDANDVDFKNGVISLLVGYAF